jgi:hypothetical protein
MVLLGVMLPPPPHLYCQLWHVVPSFELLCCIDFWRELQRNHSWSWGVLLDKLDRTPLAFKGEPKNNIGFE